MQLLILIFSFLLFFQTDVFSEKAPIETGTLIVTYQTGPKGERLNRTRFVLTKENGEPQLYPKGSACVEDPQCLSRMVVLDNLQAGNYTLKFLIPNSDGLFEEIPEKPITLASGNVLKIDQLIKPRYGTLKAHTIAWPDDFPFNTLPTVTLKDLSGQIRAQSTLGKLVAHYLVPGTYTLHFEPLSDYATPEPIKVDIEPNQETVSYQGVYKRQEDDRTIAQQVITSPNSNVIIINKEPAYLTIYSNIPKAGWKLYKNNNIVSGGSGTVVNMRIPEGDNYKVEPEEIEGYTVKVFPPFSFNIDSREYQSVEITYARTYGYVNIRGSFPDGESLEVELIPEEGQRPTIAQIKPQGGKFLWRSPPLETGDYEVRYRLPPPHESPPPQRIRVSKEEQVNLTPKLFVPGKLHVSSNIPEAIYLLKTPNNSRNWKGGGQNFTFTDLASGSYILSFAFQGKGFYIPPKEMRISVNDYENKEINVSFQPAGKIIINTNVEKTSVSIESLGSSRQSYREDISGGSKTIFLPVGKYRIHFAAQNKFNPPSTSEFEVRPFRTEELNGIYQERSTSGQGLSRPSDNREMPKGEIKLSLSSNISEAGYTIKKVTGENTEDYGHFTGKSVVIPLSESGQYEIEFDQIPNFSSPDKMSLQLNEGEQKAIVANYSPAQETALVPAGKAIIGDPTSKMENERPARTVEIDAFEIGLYEITNRQFANWLNEAIKQEKIAFVAEADQRGQILDVKGRLLFKTFEADPYSQISAQSLTATIPNFIPLAGKDAHPVINVSWYGAMAYCEDNNCRLPTEAEWEKAAAMEPVQEGEPLKKYLYGFSLDEIDRTWANYKEGQFPSQYFQVLTTPVGFYNGNNLLPLSLSSREQEKTNLAKSPYGAFDMSGNVWEWVSDWNGSDSSTVNPQGPATGSQKIVKGGCYDSLADGVRVAERLALPPDHTDAFTGFRIAKSLKR